VLKAFVCGSVLLGFVAAVSCAPASLTDGGLAPAVSHDDGTGTVGARLTLAGGAQIDVVNYTVNSVTPSGVTVVSTGTVSVSHSNSIFFEVANIPAAPFGTDILTLTAADDAGDTCVGQSALFGVTARQTTSVVVQLQCHGTANQSGSAFVTGVTGNCATWQSVATNPGEATVGQNAFITFTATGPDKAGLTYSASVVGDAGGNAVSPASGPVDPAGTTIAFQCASAGTETVQLSFGDGPVPNGITCDPTLDTVQVTVQCDNGPLPQQYLAAVAPFGIASISQTEMRFLNRDWGRNDRTFTCTKCLFQSGCLDAPSKSVKGKECEDLTGSGALQNGTTATQTQLCLDTLACELAQSTDAFNSPVPPATPGNPLSTAATCANSGFPDPCFCGMISSTAQCLTRMHNTGTCEMTESEGLGFADTDAKDVLAHYGDASKPSGLANTILACATTNACTSCLQ
jgi:hypothetical protein